MISIRPADLDAPQVIDLVARHQRELLAASPKGQAFVLDLAGLRDPAITMLSGWQDDQCVAIGALKRLGATHGELKSMRTHPGFLRRGIARQMLDELLALASREGIVRVSLETGSGERFEPALALYRQRGFVNGAAFADYRLSAFNQCLHLDL